MAELYWLKFWWQINSNLFFCTRQSKTFWRHFSHRSSWDDKSTYWVPWIFLKIYFSNVYMIDYRDDIWFWYTCSYVKSGTLSDFLRGFWPLAFWWRPLSSSTASKYIVCFGFGGMGCARVWAKLGGVRGVGCPGFNYCSFWLNVSELGVAIIF